MSENPCGKCHQFHNHVKSMPPSLMQGADDIVKLCEENTRLKSENEDLKAKVEKLKEWLKGLQFANDERSCNVPSHDGISDSEMHNRSCAGCGRYQCVGCFYDCSLLALLKES